MLHCYKYICHNLYLSKASLNAILFAILCLLLTSCEEENRFTPGIDYEWIAVDGRSHFIYVSEEVVNNKVLQREIGRMICTQKFIHDDYCEVLMWSNRRDVAKKFPIINRQTLIGWYKLKSDEVTLSPLVSE